MIVDRDIEEGTGTSPDLAVSSTGQADVVYRVIATDKVGVSLLRAGDVPESVRVAHFDGRRWSNLGAINRDSAVGMRPPTQANAPQIAIGPTGNGVVVWQEPDIEGVARIWARRIFGSALDYVMPVSAETYNGAPITDDADAPSVAFSRLGQAEVAYRQAAGPILAAAGAAHLPEHPARRRIGQRGRVSGSGHRRLECLRRQERDGRAAERSTSTKSAPCACSTTTTAPHA